MQPSRENFNRRIREKIDVSKEEAKREMEELDDSKLVDVATAMRQTGMSYPHKRVVSEDDDGIMLLLGVLYVGWIILRLSIAQNYSIHFNAHFSLRYSMGGDKVERQELTLFRFKPDNFSV